jgi:DNA repair protein RecN (Recombination protein N)
MLRLIRIRNLALIRELEIEFERGLSLLTGETGSGKSILVDAFGLLLGARSSQDMIRSGCDTAVLEGIFEVQPRGSVIPLLEEAGLEAEDDSLLIRREISSAGRNRVFLNNRLASLSMLKALGDRLGDIHGQQDQRSLLDLSTHLTWLDDFGGNADLVREVEESYKKLRELAARLDSLEMNEQERLRRIDVLEFQIDEIRRVNPQPNEKEELEGEKTILSNREKLLALATEAYDALYESESSVLRGVSRVDRLLESLMQFDRGWHAHREALRESRYRLEDLAYAARDYAARSDFSPERLEQVHQRLYALEKLTQKYGSSIGEVLDYAQACERELQELLARSDSCAQLSRELEEEMKEYRARAWKLSEKRRGDAARLEREIRGEFAALAMERMEMRVHFHPPKEDETRGRVPASWGYRGMDRVEFLIAPNKGEEIRPLARIASGGELSRLMLAIQSLCGTDEKDRTLVFDEVDSGIGGRVAEAVGKRLREIAASNQVLCVTHLPQIAAFAQNHYRVHKDVAAGRTETFVKKLSESERVQELSRMLGGKAITEATRRYAAEMLKRSTGP